MITLSFGMFFELLLLAALYGFFHGFTVQLFGREK